MCQISVAVVTIIPAQKTTTNNIKTKFLPGLWRTTATLPRHCVDSVEVGCYILFAAPNCSICLIRMAKYLVSKLNNQDSRSQIGMYLYRLMPKHTWISELSTTLTTTWMQIIEITIIFQKKRLQSQKNPKRGKTIGLAKI